MWNWLSFTWYTKCIHWFHNLHCELVFKTICKFQQTHVNIACICFSTLSRLAEWTVVFIANFLVNIMTQCFNQQVSSDILRIRKKRTSTTTNWIVYDWGIVGWSKSEYTIHLNNMYPVTKKSWLNSAAHLICAPSQVDGQ